MWNTRLFLGEKPPMIGWCKARTLKDCLVRAKINNVDTKELKSARCNGRSSQVCQYIEETHEFEDADGNKYYICKGVINCKTDFTAHKFHCSSCSKQYVGSNIPDFRIRFNNYNSAFRRVSKSGKPRKVNQEHFHQHLKLFQHNGMDDWRVTLIDIADNRKELRRRENFCQYKLNTFFPHGLNYIILLLLLLISNSDWRIDFFYSSGIVYPCLSIVTCKPFYVQCLFYCSVLVFSPFYH